MSKLVHSLLLLLVLAACGSGSAEDAPRHAQEAAWSSLPTGWSRLPPPPHEAACAASVWTGAELVYWGGDDSCHEGTARNEGGAFNPAAGTWRLLPPSPLGGRSSSGAVWTGEEVLVWGGWADSVRGDGAAYRPATDEWRMLSGSPLGARTPVAAVWTGREMLVWGDVSRGGEATDGAAYEPASDSWRPLAPAPFGLNQANAVWTGREMIVYGALLDGRNFSDEEHASGLAYNPATDSWRVLAPSQLSPQASTAVWTGAEMVAWDYDLHAAAYDPGSDSWRALPDLPLDFYECYPQGAVVGALVLAWHCGRAAVLDLAVGTWRKLPAAPGAVVGEPVAAGPVVLFAGAWPGAGNTLSAFRAGPLGPTVFVPRTERRGERDVVPLAFPDGTSVVLSYPLELDLAGMTVQPEVSYLYRKDRPSRFPITFVYGPAEPAPEQIALRFGSWTALAELRDRREAETIARSLHGRETPEGFPVIEALPPIALSDESGEGDGPRLTIGVRKEHWIELEPEECNYPPELGSTYGSLCLGGRITVGIYGDRDFVEAVLVGLRLERR
ncbi:MAG: Kelch repeat-containing protein [Candidatus Limnocylindria bacterium]